MSSMIEGALPEVSAKDRERLLSDLLRGVSRSFYLTIRILPAYVRSPVGLAYLLARTADTISDTRLLPPRERLRHLLRFREQVAYLLGRAADTIADTRLLPPSQRLAQLIKFRGQIEGLRHNGPSVRQIGQALTDKQDLPQERALLESLPQVFSVLDSLVEPDRFLDSLSGW